MKEHHMIWDGYFKMPLNRDPDLAFMDRISKSSMRLELSRSFDCYLDVGVISDHDRLIRKFGTVSPTYRLLGVCFSNFLKKKIHMSTHSFGRLCAKSLGETKTFFFLYCGIRKS